MTNCVDGRDGHPVDQVTDNRQERISAHWLRGAGLPRLCSSSCTSAKEKGGAGPGSALQPVRPPQRRLSCRREFGCASIRCNRA